MIDVYGITGRAETARRVADSLEKETVEAAEKARATIYLRALADDIEALVGALIEIGINNAIASQAEKRLVELIMNGKE